MSENIQTVNEETVVTPTSPKSKGSSLKLIVLGLLLVGIATFVVIKYDLLGSAATSDGTGASALDADAIVAKTDTITITRGELDEKINQVKRSLPADAVDPTQDAAFELQLLEDLVSLKLLTAEAVAKNYTVSDDELNAELTLLTEQFGGQEALKEQTDALGITDEALRENMRNELLIRQLLEAETTIGSVEVSEEEIAEAYASAVGEAEDAPPLEQVSEMLRSEIMNQKSGEIVKAYVDEIRSKVNVEVTL